MSLMMKKLIFVIGLLFYSAGTLLTGAVVKNSDQPQRGKWDYKPEKTWMLDAVGNDVLVEVTDVKVDQQGNLYIGEKKQKKFYVLDPEGKLITAFGKEGEGPGEFKYVGDFFIVEDYLIISDIAKLHYWSKKGEFIRDINPGKMLFPRLFIDENRMILLSYLPFQKRKEPNYIEIYDLKTNKSKNLVQLELEEGCLLYAKEGMRIALNIPNTTPTIFFAVDSQGLFYANNNQYRINKVDFGGSTLLSFSIEGRKKNRISKSTKRRHFKDTVKDFKRYSEVVVNEMVKQIPDDSPYFKKILIDKKGCIYVLLIDMENQNKQAIDIFSPDGKYLYRSEINLSGDFERINTLAFSFGRSELFVFAENDEGEGLLVKYKISLPQ